MMSLESISEKEIRDYTPKKAGMLAKAGLYAMMGLSLAGVSGCASTKTALHTKDVDPEMTLDVEMSPDGKKVILRQNLPGDRTETYTFRGPAVRNLQDVEISNLRIVKYNNDPNFMPFTSTTYDDKKNIIDLEVLKAKDQQGKQILRKYRCAIIEYLRR
jgi:hypothetical protein